MDDYCLAHKNNDYCDKINQYISSGFCQICCKGNYKQFWQPPLDEWRETYRQELTEEQKSNKDEVSVIIPVCEADSQYLQRTMKSVSENAVGDVEIIPIFDTDGEGVRVMMNRGVDKAKGKYVVKLDCHCAMSPGWDARMKASCKGDVIIKPMLDTLDIKTWKGVGRDMGFVSLNPYFRNEHVMDWKSLPVRKIEEESLSMLGCCFMTTKEYYKASGGCDESLSKWGALGLEWALKTWLTGGRLLIRTDTVCYHFFRDTKPFAIKEIAIDKTFKKVVAKWYNGLGENQDRPLPWLFEKFKDNIEINKRIAPKEQRTSSLRA